MQALYDTLKQRDGKPQRPGIVYNPIGLDGLQQ